MIVYIVEAMSAQAYENSSWIIKAFDSEDKANIWVDGKLKEELSNLDYDQYCYIITEQELE